MTEKFKTKYHALAWAAEDSTNIFVDSAGLSFRVGLDIIMRQCASDGIWNTVSSDYIKEPCHKLEVEKSNAQLATIADKQFMGHGDMVQFILDECDNRYARLK